MGVELPLRVVVTILECCVTFSGVKLSIRSFVLFRTSAFKSYRRFEECFQVKSFFKISFNNCMDVIFQSLNIALLKDGLVQHVSPSLTTKGDVFVFQNLA